MHSQSNQAFVKHCSVCSPQGLNILVTSNCACCKLQLGREPSAQARKALIAGSGLSSMLGWLGHALVSCIARDSLEYAACFAHDYRTWVSACRFAMSKSSISTSAAHSQPHSRKTPAQLTASCRLPQAMESRAHCDLRRQSNNTAAHLQGAQLTFGQQAAQQ